MTSTSTQLTFMGSIAYEIVVDSDESEHRLELLHDNVKKYGTVFNTVAPGTALSGVLRRADRLGPVKKQRSHLAGLFVRLRRCGKDYID